MRHVGKKSFWRFAIDLDEARLIVATASSNANTD
jgi:hypothetical protein